MGTDGIDGTDGTTAGRAPTERPRVAQVGVWGKDPELITCIGIGDDSSEDQEEKLAWFSCRGWRVTGVGSGPPIHRNVWVDIERPAGARTDGRNADGTPIQRYAYRVVGKQRDLVDRGEADEIAALVADGWRIVHVLGGQPWQERPMTFLERPIDLPIEVDPIPEDEEPFRSEADITPEQRMQAIARALLDGRDGGAR